MRRLAEEVVQEAIDRFHPRLVLACSFQKEESVLIDMLMRVTPFKLLPCVVVADRVRASRR